MAPPVPNNSPAPKPAPGPNPGLGGLNLAALASQSMAETDRRIAGQSSLIDTYLDQVLGLNNARNSAESERDERMKSFQRQQALLREQLDRQRMTQDEAMQRARIQAASSEGDKSRAHRSVLSAEERAFELGQAATQQDRQALENRMLELQIQQMEREVGPQNPQFGRHVASADRGAALSPGRQQDLRETTFTEKTGGGGFKLPNIGLLGGDGNIRIGGSLERTQTTTYDDLARDAEGIVNEYGEDPNEVTRRIKLLARERPQLASLLLYDLGYNPGAYLAE